MTAVINVKSDKLWPVWVWSSKSHSMEQCCSVRYKMCFRVVWCL